MKFKINVIPAPTDITGAATDADFLDSFKWTVIRTYPAGSEYVFNGNAESPNDIELNSGYSPTSIMAKRDAEQWADKYAIEQANPNLSHVYAYTTKPEGLNVKFNIGIGLHALAALDVGADVIKWSVSRAYPPEMIASSDLVSNELMTGFQSTMILAKRDAEEWAEEYVIKTASPDFTQSYTYESKV